LVDDQLISESCFYPAFVLLPPRKGLCFWIRPLLLYNAHMTTITISPGPALRPSWRPDWRVLLSDSKPLPPPPLAVKVSFLFPTPETFFLPGRVFQDDFSFMTLVLIGCHILILVPASAYSISFLGTPCHTPTRGNLTLLYSVLSESAPVLLLLPSVWHNEACLGSA